MCPAPQCRSTDAQVGLWEGRPQFKFVHLDSDELFRLCGEHLGGSIRVGKGPEGAVVGAVLITGKRNRWPYRLGTRVCTGQTAASGPVILDARPPVTNSGTPSGVTKMDGM